MNCKNFQKMIASEYLDGEAKEKEVFELEAHIAVCPSCRQYLEALRAQRHMFFRQEASTGPSPEVWFKIKHRILEKELKHQDVPSLEIIWQKIKVWFIFPRISWVIPVFLIAVFSFGRSDLEVPQVLPETRDYLIRGADFLAENAEGEDAFYLGSVVEDFFI